MDYEINQEFECQQCGMKFFNSHELVNHTKKFCFAAGLNSLEGLANYENKNAYSFSKKQNPIPDKKSQNNLKYDYGASQLQKDAKDFNKHKEQLSMNRPYSNFLSPTLSKTSQKTSSRLKESEYNIRPIAKSGSRILGQSQVSMKPLNDFANNQPSLAYVKLPGATVLNKSNTSIANMTKQQREDYVNQKLLELKNISEMYDKSGGQNNKVRINVQKMEKFYKKMLQDEPKQKSQFGEFYQSRVQTPINKLREENLPNSSYTLKNKNMQDSLDRQIIKSKNSSKASISMFEEQPEYKPKPKMKKSKNPYPYMYPPYPFYPPQQTQPQIIMMPQYQQPQPQPVDNTNQQIKYLQKMMELKNDENKKLMEMIMKVKEQKNNFKENMSKIHQSRASSIVHDQNHLYHLQKPMQETNNMTPEQRMLVALHREELDELKLLSNLPEELQEIKMQSVMKLVEARTQIEKEVLKQKIQRLEEQENNQLSQEKRKLENDKWVNQERRRMIKEEMNSYGDRFNEYDEEDEEGEYEDEQEGIGYEQ